MLDPLNISFDTSLPAPASSAVVLPTRRLLQAIGNDDYILELDYSALSTFMSCPRSFENKHVRSRESLRPTHATQFGKLFHSCEELRLASVPDWQDAQTKLVIQHFLQHPVPPDEYRTGDRMLDILRLYNSRYANDAWPERILSFEGKPFVERAFKLELCTIPVNSTIPYSADLVVAGVEQNPAHVHIRYLHVLFTGRVDAILFDGTNHFVIDHKTSSHGGTEFFDYFHLSLQTRGYAWAAQKITGLSFFGLIMNAVIVRALTKTGTGTELSRSTYPYSEDSLAEWQDDVVAHIEDLTHCLVRGFFPQESSSFKSPCSGCEYHNNCRLPRHQRLDDLASGDYRNLVWDPITNQD